MPLDACLAGCLPVVPSPVNMPGLPTGVAARVTVTVAIGEHSSTPVAVVGRTVAVGASMPPSKRPGRLETT